MGSCGLERAKTLTDSDCIGYTCAPAFRQFTHVPTNIYKRVKSCECVDAYMYLVRMYGRNSITICWHGGWDFHLPNFWR